LKNHFEEAEEIEVTDENDARYIKTDLDDDGQIGLSFEYP
jgi:hypothetical protein